MRLPEFMIPESIVILDRIPMTINGKVDRKALALPPRSARTEHERPRNDVERTLAAIWAELFALERIGIDEDFFELGGHSLLATRLISRANVAFGVRIPLRRAFELRTIAEFARAVEEARVVSIGAGPSIARLTRRPIRIPSDPERRAADTTQEP